VGRRLPFTTGYRKSSSLPGPRAAARPKTGSAGRHVCRASHRPAAWLEVSRRTIQCTCHHSRPGKGLVKCPCVRRRTLQPPPLLQPGPDCHCRRQSGYLRRSAWRRWGSRRCHGKSLKRPCGLHPAAREIEKMVLVQESRFCPMRMVKLVNE
jgi:hypothetical protein